VNRKQLIEAMQAKNAQVQTILAKGEELTGDDVLEAKKLNAEIKEHRAALEALSAATELGADAKSADAFLNEGKGFNHGNGTPGGSSKNVLGNTPAGTTWMSRNADGSINVESIGKGLYGEKKYAAMMEDDYKAVYAKYIMKGDRALSSAELKTLQEGYDDEGGYFAPPDYTMSLIQRKPTPTSLNPNVFKWQTRSDSKIFPKIPYAGASDDPNAVLYSTGVRVTYPGEIPAADIADVVEPAFGEFRVDVHTAMMCISLTRNMLDDSPQSVMDFIGQKFQETDSLELDNRILNGTGTGQAAGVLLNPVAGAVDPNFIQFIKSGNASAVTDDGITSLIYALAPQYLANAKFAMGWSSAGQAIEKLKDSEGRKLWSNGLQDNGLQTAILERRLKGFMVAYTEFSQAVAANSFPIVFGDWLGYYLVERLGLSLQVLHETRAKRNQVEVVARRRFGGGVAEPYRFKAQKIAA
jgi:HK97 family phage major capsid protein